MDIQFLCIISEGRGKQKPFLDPPSCLGATAVCPTVQGRASSENTEALDFRESEHLLTSSVLERKMLKLASDALVWVPALLLTNQAALGKSLNP